MPRGELEKLTKEPGERKKGFPLNEDPRVPRTRGWKGAEWWEGKEMRKKLPSPV